MSPTRVLVNVVSLALLATSCMFHTIMYVRTGSTFNLVMAAFVAGIFAILLVSAIRFWRATRRSRRG